MNQYLKSKKIGFIGSGNMAQAIIRGMIEGSWLQPQQIWASNRSPGKLQKLVDDYKINAASTNEQVVETCDIVILSVKPQDLASVMEATGSIFSEQQIVISLAAGIRMQTLEKYLPNCRWVRLMPNTPTLIGKGVLGYLMNDPDDEGLDGLIEDLFSQLGSVIRMETEDQLEALTVAASAGTGFLFELMMYWQEWIEEHDFDPQVAKKITLKTFLGAAQLAMQSLDSSLEELQNRVASRKGVTAAGLESMRELEIERALRISFEKAAMRNSEIAREMK